MKFKGQLKVNGLLHHDYLHPDKRKGKYTFSGQDKDVMADWFLSHFPCGETPAQAHGGKCQLCYSAECILDRVIPFPAFNSIFVCQWFPKKVISEE